MPRRFKWDHYPTPRVEAIRNSTLAFCQLG